MKTHREFAEEQPLQYHGTDEHVPYTVGCIHGIDINVKPEAIFGYTKENFDMQSATRTAVENVAMRDMEQALETQSERNRQRAIAIINYWMYQGSDEEVFVATYVKQLEDKIKALQGISGDE